MSRSRRRTPIVGITTADSEKDDKRQANQNLRHAVRRALRTGAEVIPTLRDVSDVWTFAKDGKHWWQKDDRRK